MVPGICPSTPSTGCLNSPTTALLQDYRLDLATGMITLQHWLIDPFVGRSCMTTAIKTNCKSKWSSKMISFDPCPLPVAIPVALMQDSAKSGAAPAGKMQLTSKWTVFSTIFRCENDRKCLLAFLLLALSKLHKSITWRITASTKSLFLLCCSSIMALFSTYYRSNCRPKRTTYLRQLTEFWKYCALWIQNILN